MDKTAKQLKELCKEKGLPVTGNKQTLVSRLSNTYGVDKYPEELLRERYNMFKQGVIQCARQIKEYKLPLRNQNPPEDITENIAKFIIQNYEGDTTIRWAKSLGVPGDLVSKHRIIELKSFISSGPSSFGPNKKFNVIYFLDLRDFMKDVIVLWKVNVTNDSPEWKNIKMNKTETHAEQCSQGRRPHISWDNIKVQIEDKCEKVYEGTFEGIFRRRAMNSTGTDTAL